MPEWYITKIGHESKQLPNAGGEPRPMAEATQERKLLGVGSTAWFGPARAQTHGCGSLSYGSGSTSGT